MTCIVFHSPTGSGIMCVPPPEDFGRLHVNGKYIWVDFHRYCGPQFTHDRNGTREYIPKDEQDPVWPAFNAWFEKRNATITRNSKKEFNAKQRTNC